MPDEVAILRSQAATLTDAAMIVSTKGRKHLAAELRLLASALLAEANERAKPHQWTGSHPGDILGP